MLNFIWDLSHFLLLLLTMQQLKNQHWGLNHHINLNFGKLFTASTMVLIEDSKKGPIDFLLNYPPNKQVPHHNLNGQATNIYFAMSQKFKSKRRLIVKLFWSEKSHVIKFEILIKFYEITEIERNIQNHISTMVFFHKFSNSSIDIIC